MADNIKDIHSFYKDAAPYGIYLQKIEITKIPSGLELELHRLEEEKNKIEKKIQQLKSQKV